MSEKQENQKPLLFRYTGRKFYLLKVSQNMSHPAWGRLAEIKQLREHGYFYVYDLLELIREGHSVMVLENVGGRPAEGEPGLSLRELKEGVSEKRLSRFDITKKILLNSLVDDLRDNEFYHQLDSDDIGQLERLASNPEKAAKAMAEAAKNL